LRWSPSAFVFVEHHGRWSASLTAVHAVYVVCMPVLGSMYTNGNTHCCMPRSTVVMTVALALTAFAAEVPLLPAKR
jgi:hypothetical protein